MWIDEGVMDTREKLGYRLRELYQKHGYSRYRMSKFEEYDLYSRNRDFLLSENVITFTDTNGRLMALKPDVTLSIVKNMKDAPSGLRKLYYHEQVYRAADAEEGFREQTQVGLECMGQVDEECIAEVLGLAAESLRLCSDHAVLEISHLGILKAATDELAGDTREVRDALLHCVSGKNLHGIREICRERNLPEVGEARLTELTGLYGTPEEVLPKLGQLAWAPEIEGMKQELERIIQALGERETDPEPRLLIDFSATEDLRYYNGIAFKGFVEGIPGSVLSGGQYDGLMRRMGRKDQAIGFAVFLNMLERLREGEMHA